MVKVFIDCFEKMILKSEKLLREKEVSSGGEDTIELDLEAEFSSLALDIIGFSVFNYNFGSVTKESHVVKETDVENLQQHDYSNLKDASLIQFLVDMRGVDIDDRQARLYNLLLIVGHETTAASLTLNVYLLAQNPEKKWKAQAEVDIVFGEGAHTNESLKKLEYVTL
ncbi:unnamed protein product [Eruca vesicaria subsp. sativa]|uniref:Cytochrome P450 n=1 Tax=Eruca vesicaria subsp. sativa TaxID=29727 RepID=A0ABC8KE61_ERUVS|nr:unnamed protein product [Eruca vesicaria subsp. sativa]